MSTFYSVLCKEQLVNFSVDDVSWFVQADLKFSQNEAAILRQQGASGAILLGLTEAKLERWGLPEASIQALMAFIIQMRGAGPKQVSIRVKRTGSALDSHKRVLFSGPDDYRDFLREQDASGLVPEDEASQHELWTSGCELGVVRGSQYEWLRYAGRYTICPRGGLMAWPKPKPIPRTTAAVEEAEEQEPKSHVDSAASAESGAEAETKLLNGAESIVIHHDEAMWGTRLVRYNEGWMSEKRRAAFTGTGAALGSASRPMVFLGQGLHVLMQRAARIPDVAAADAVIEQVRTTARVYKRAGWHTGCRVSSIVVPDAVSPDARQALLQEGIHVLVVDAPARGNYLYQPRAKNSEAYMNTGIDTTQL